MHRAGVDSGPMVPLAHAHTVHVPIGVGTIEGTLAIPAHARGIVVFAQEGAGTRYSLRNVAIARPLHERGFGTLLLDLLTATEDHEPPWSSSVRGDVALLARRLLAAAAFLALERSTLGLGLGCYGVGNGAAAALIAAARAPGRFKAIVSRGGYVGTATGIAANVAAPTLLIVGDSDDDLRLSNTEIYTMISAPKELLVVDGATQMFERAEALEEIAQATAGWFERFLGAAGRIEA